MFVIHVVNEYLFVIKPSQYVYVCNLFYMSV